MEFDYQKIKSGFIEYLQDIASNGETAKAYDTSSAARLFSYTNEFEDYLDTINISSDAMSIDMSILKDMKIENGKVIPENGFGNKSNKFMTAVLNDMLTDDEVKKSIDTDIDGNLSKAEIENFFEAIAKNDNSGNDITFKDVTVAIDNIFMATPKNDDAPDTNNNNNNTPDNNTTTQTKDINTMNLEQLKAEKTSREGKLDEATTALNKVHDDTDEKVAQAKSNMDKAKENYENLLEADNAVPEELKTQRKENQKAIETNEEQIKTTQKDISTAETNIFNQEEKLTNIEGVLGQMNASLQSLESQKKSLNKEDENYQSKLSKINSKIAALKEQINTTTGERDKAEADLNTMKSELEAKKTKLTELEAKKVELEQKRTEIENEITACASDEVKEALKNYQNLRQEYETIKAQRLSEAQKTVETAKAAIKEVTTKITEKEKAKVANENNVLLDDIFSNEISLKFEDSVDLDGDGRPDCGVILPEPYDENATYPMIVYLHGADGYKNGATKGLLDSDLANFNGIVLCPIASGSNWSLKNDAMAKKVMNLTDIAIGKYNIDESQITLMGYSAGGIGALDLLLYAQREDKNLFARAAIISPAKSNGYSAKLENMSYSDFDIPVQLYFGDNDGCAVNASRFNGEIPPVITVPGTDHGSVATKLMQLDIDGDGCPDVIKWLYSE